ncbi:MAG: hypothetical protein WDM81_08155 [Rhizomicrobium sp.]
MIGVCALAEGSLRNLLGRFDAVEFRHLDVHEDDVEVAGTQRIIRLMAIVGNDDIVTGFGQNMDSELLVDLVVLGEKNAQGRAGHHRRSRASGAFRLAVPPLTVDVDQAIEHLVLPHGLFQDRIEAVLRLFEAVAAARRDEHQLGVGEMRTASDSLGQYVAGNSRHHAIEEDNVVGRAAVPGTF